MRQAELPPAYIIELTELEVKLEKTEGREDLI